MFMLGARYELDAESMFWLPPPGMEDPGIGWPVALWTLLMAALNMEKPVSFALFK
jgi:hypothetical protein